MLVIKRAHLNGVQVAAGSNPVTPTIKRESIGEIGSLFLLSADILCVVKSATSPQEAPPTHGMDFLNADSTFPSAVNVFLHNQQVLTAGL